MNGTLLPGHNGRAAADAQLRPMRRIGAAALLAMGWLFVGCDNGSRTCDQTCPDVSGAFSLVAIQPLGSCDFSSYLPPPTLTISQTDGGRHMASELIDPVNRLFVSIEGDVLPPDGSTGSGNFQVHTRLLRQASASDPRLFTVELLMSGTVTRSAEGATLSSTLTEVQQEPDPGAGCTITLPLNGRTGRP